LAGRPELEYRKASSSPVVSAGSSLLVRFRTSLLEGMEEKEPEFLFFWVADSIFLRLLLMVPVLFEIGLLRQLLSGHNALVGSLFFVVLVGSFFHPLLTLLGCLVAIYLVGEIVNLKRVGALLSAGVAAASWAYSREWISFHLLCLVLSAVVGLVLCKGGTKQSRVLCILSAVTLNLTVASALSWEFLGLASPIHLLLAILFVITPRLRKEDYSGVKTVELDEEEGSVMRINRIPEH
jgi:hypothetical protein